MAALVLFGGGGDLAMRMLLPSLYFLEHDGLLPDGLKIIGAARSDETRDEYVAKVRAASGATVVQHSTTPPGAMRGKHPSWPNNTASAWAALTTKTSSQEM